MKKPRFNVKQAKAEVKEITVEIEENTICPHCKRKMELGSMSWRELKYGCYKNLKCKFRLQQGYGYTIDFGFKNNERYNLGEKIRIYEEGFEDGKI